MSQQVRIAVAGVGRIGSMHAGIIARQTQGARLVAVADVNADAAREVAHGTVFKVYLPLANAEHAVTSVPEPLPRAATTERILLVEDNDALAANIGELAAPGLVGRAAREVVDALAQPKLDKDRLATRPLLAWQAVPRPCALQHEDCAAGCKGGRR